MNCVMYPIYQKYYNSLQQLIKVDTNINLLQNIVYIDAFLQEFQTILNVARKSIKPIIGKKNYEALWDAHFKDKPVIKYLVIKRDETTHEKPFPLIKHVVIDASTAMGSVNIIDRTFSIENEEELKDIIESFIRSKNYPEQKYFHINILFEDDNAEFSLWDSLIYGIKEMNQYVSNLESQYPCDCKQCNKLKETIKKNIIDIIGKNIQFDTDYEMRDNCLFQCDKIELILDNGQIEKLDRFKNKTSFKDYSIRMKEKIETVS